MKSSIHPAFFVPASPSPPGLKATLLFSVLLLLRVALPIDALVFPQRITSSTKGGPGPSHAHHIGNHRLCGSTHNVNPRPKFSDNVLQSQYPNWEGDDIRWTRKLRRRFKKLNGRSLSARSMLVFLNVTFFLYQVVNATSNIRRRYPQYWPRDALAIVVDVISGRSITGPFTMDFIHSTSLSKYQPHRYLTAGFLHGSIIHLAVNLNVLLGLPMWLESGLGWPLYLTTYLISIIVGNAVHRNPSSLCVGASGGICGLYGLMFTALQKMGNKTGVSSILRSMIVLVFTGFVFENISNAGHVGGFLAGLAVGYLCGPGYRKSYSMRRKWSLEVDEAPADYRQAMGFGNTPTKRALIPVQFVWVAAAFAILSQPRLRSIPKVVLRGFLHPGSLAGPRYI